MVLRRPTPFKGALVVPKYRRVDRIFYTERVLQRIVLAIVALANLLIIISLIYVYQDNTRLGAMVVVLEQFSGWLIRRGEVKCYDSYKGMCCGSARTATWHCDWKPCLNSYRRTYLPAKARNTPQSPQPKLVRNFRSSKFKTRNPLLITEQLFITLIALLQAIYISGELPSTRPLALLELVKQSLVYSSSSTTVRFV